METRPAIRTLSIREQVVEIVRTYNKLYTDIRNVEDIMRLEVVTQDEQRLYIRPRNYTTLLGASAIIPKIDTVTKNYYIDITKNEKGEDRATLRVFGL